MDMSDEKSKLPVQQETLIVQSLIKSGLFVQRELNLVCQQFGLNTNQFNVLNEIILRGPFNQKVLCKRLLFEKSNISKIVRSLLDKELINVATAPEDRRLTLLIETQKGVELWKDCQQKFYKSSIELMSALSEEEIHNAINLLKRLEHEFKSISDQ